MSLNEKPAPLDKELVLEFVKAAHGNLARVQEMLADEPALVNATWNWGGDDWETAVEGSAHTGQKEIAQLLIANGARTNIFTAAMLGKIGIVKAYIEDDPAIVHVKGPHGIPLINHARVGGQDEIVALIEEYL